MNILELTKSLHKGGVESHILDLSESLMTRGHKVIVGADNLLEMDAFKKKKIEVFEIKFMSKNPIILISAIRQLHKLIMDHQVDVVHCHWRICCLYMKIHNILYKEKVHYVWTCHSAGMNTSFLMRKMSFFDKYIIGCSSDCSNMVIDTFKVNASRVQTVYNGIHVLDEKERNKNIDSENFRITILSRMAPVKNHACMLRALQRLVYEHRIEHVILRITGDGNDEYKVALQKLCYDLNINDYVQFCGYIAPYNILGDTDVMVLPSNFEGFPISVLEAFNMKVPVVRTRTGGYSDVKEYCWAFEFDDDGQLANILAEMYFGKINISDKVEAAYEFLRNECSIDKMTECIENIYAQATKG